MACSVSAAPTGHTPVCQAAAATVYGSFGATSAVSVATYADTTAGNYTITITGTNEQQSQSVQIPLQVTAGPGFTLTAATSSLSIVMPGQPATDTLTLSATQSFTGTVSLSCIVTPAPSSGKAPACTLPASVVFGTGTQTAALQVTSDSTTPPGPYSVAITATSGVLQQTLTIPVTVQIPPTPSFGLSAANSAVSVAAAGQSATDTLTITPAGGFTGTVQLTCIVSENTPATPAPTCSLPATASVTGASPVTATLTVNTTGSTAALVLKDRRLFGSRIGGLALGCVLAILVPRRRKWIAMALFVLVVAGVWGVTGCGGSGNSGTPPTGGTTGTPAGSYTVAVTATGGSINATTTIQVTVQ
jgi:trimeric autotransporter adhesin